MQTHTPDDFQAIAKDASARWDAAFNAKQPAQVAAFYDAAASLLPAGGPAVSGLEGIERFWQDLFAQGVVDHRIEIDEVVTGSELAIQRGKWSAAAHDAAGAHQTFGGNLLLVHRRQADGSWKILNHIWNL